MNFDKVIAIDFGKCLQKIRKRAFFILVTAVTGAFLGWLLSSTIISSDSLYRASASVYCFSDGSPYESEQGNSVLRIYSEIIKSYKIAEGAKKLLGDTDISAEEIYQMISTDDRFVAGSTYIYENMSSVIHIYAEGENPEKCKIVANAVAEAFVQEMNKLATSDSIQVLDHALVSEEIKNAKENTLLIVIAGMLGLTFIYIIMIVGTVIFSDKLETVRDAELYGQLTVLGTIPYYKE